MNKLQKLFSEQGQSPWLDNIRREWITSGQLQSWVEAGVRGVTSNPTIFQKAMSGTTVYDSDLAELTKKGKSVEESYWSLAIEDITAALKILRPVYDNSHGVDGYVSIEVDPVLSDDTASTISAARLLHQQIDEPNLYVKIPATKEGIPAIKKMISEGRSINVTLIFSLERYQQVIEAYISGLEEHPGDLSNISSVASFFISRTDTEVDRQLTALNDKRALELRGRAAIAQGRIAYQQFQNSFTGKRWQALEARGAQLQRPLWASTSTKNPEYSETLYVDQLIGPNTVNTLPDTTLQAFMKHGTITRTIDDGIDTAKKDLEDINSVGVNLVDVAKHLEEEGVTAFQKSFDELLGNLKEKSLHVK